VTNTSVDYLLERRRLGRKITLWRVVAFAAVLVAILVLTLRGASMLSETRPHIAKLKLTGIITGDERTLKRLRELRNSQASAVILEINSPGGTTEGSEVLYEEIRRLDEKKPVVAVVDGMAASGAYIAAIGAEHIFARGNSIVGSIGVLVQYPNFSGLMDKLGVKYEAIKSSPLKASPNGFEPTSQAAHDAIEALVLDSYKWFKDLVRERRGLSEAELVNVADGRVFDGRQGLPLKLIDAIGGEREAIVWLESTKNIAKDLPIRDVTDPPSFAGAKLFSLASAALQAIGMSNLASALSRDVESDVGSVDGLMSLWQL
jgi:protease IV